MKITNAKMLEVLNFFEEIKDFFFPQKIAYAIAKNSKILTKEYEDFYLERLNMIFDNAKKNNWVVIEDGQEKCDKNGTPIIKHEYIEEFEEELNELLYYELEISGWIGVDDCAFDYNSDKYTVLSPKQLSILMDILTT